MPDSGAPEVLVTCPVTVAPGCMTASIPVTIWPAETGTFVGAIGPGSPR